MKASCSDRRAHLRKRMSSLLNRKRLLCESASYIPRTCFETTSLNREPMCPTDRVVYCKVVVEVVVLRGTAQISDTHVHPAAEQETSCPEYFRSNIRDLGHSWAKTKGQTRASTAVIRRRFTASTLYGDAAESRLLLTGVGVEKVTVISKRSGGRSAVQGRKPSHACWITISEACSS